MSQYETLLVEQVGKVAHIQINRPEKINAMNRAFWLEIIDVFKWVDETPEVRCAVISGAGKHFSAGIDLQMLAEASSGMDKDIGRKAEAIRRNVLQLQESFNVIDRCRKPVIAAIHGYCIGGAIGKRRLKWSANG